MKVDYKKIKENIKKKEKEAQEGWKECKEGMKIFEDWENDESLINRKGGQSGKKKSRDNDTARK